MVNKTNTLGSGTGVNPPPANGPPGMALIVSVEPAPIVNVLTLTELALTVFATLPSPITNVELVGVPVIVLISAKAVDPGVYIFKVLVP
jgi:hypothetical protein